MGQWYIYFQNGVPYMHNENLQNKLFVFKGSEADCCEYLDNWASKNAAKLKGRPIRETQSTFIDYDKNHKEVEVNGKDVK